jgi:hypothetical protein
MGVRLAEVPPAVFPPYSTIGPPKSLTSFLIGGQVGADLATLVLLLADGGLRRDRLAWTLRAGGAGR